MLPDGLWSQGCLPLQWGVALGTSLTAAIFDCRYRRIPNLLTGPVLVGGLAWASWAAGFVGMADSALAAVAMAAPYLLLFLFAGGGAGDVKLMASIGAWLGVVNGLIALGAVALAGVVLALCVSLVKRRMRRVLTNTGAIFTRGILAILGRNLRPSASGQEAGTVQIPYGVAIFLGVCSAATGVLIWRA